MMEIKVTMINLINEMLIIEPVYKETHSERDYPHPPTPSPPKVVVAVFYT